MATVVNEFGIQNLITQPCPCCGRPGVFAVDELKPVLIPAPAKCAKCAITFNAPTTGMLPNRCDVCGGELLSTNEAKGEQ